MTEHVFFNAHHAPIGAFASFTLGCRGAKGGLGLELGGPADENVYIGVETRAGGRYEALPFYQAGEDEAKRYDVESEDGQKAAGEAPVKPFDAQAIQRDFHASLDAWKAGDLTMIVYSPVMSVPDPRRAKKAELQFALCPAVLVELTVDNTNCNRRRTLFFGYQGSDRYRSMWQLDENAKGQFAGIAQGRSTAVVSVDKGVRSAQGFSLENILACEEPENLHFGLGGVAALVAQVPANKLKTYRFAVCFYRDGIVTAGLDARYYYTRLFNDIQSVGRYALNNFAKYKKTALKADRRIETSRLSADQKFQLCHAIRSYYGSTQLLEWKGKPFWVVNEGEYRMMNTFDLTVDQLFFEMRMNPWTVRNVLDMYVARYSYADKAHFPGGKNEHMGGLSFTHDMGVANHVSRPRHSTYELTGLSGCFSHMTHEQLVNWVLCGAVYAHHAGDKKWLKDNLAAFQKCLKSLVNRDHPNPQDRNGIMGLDSSRCGEGAEITTYDSLDESLGQARNNLYLAVKTWAAYVALERIFRKQGQKKDARMAGTQAERCASTICSFMTGSGYIPAVMGEKNDSRIISAIEGLVFPFELDLQEALDEGGRFGNLIQALSRHVATILKPGTCLFADGGWKLSSTADNSWLSKIYLAQFVYRRVLGFPWDEKGKKADAAHVGWLLDERNAYWAWSDQMVCGHAQGSKYYPRGVTAILWLDE